MAVPNSCSTVSGFQGPRPPCGGLPRQAARLYITRPPPPAQGPVSLSIFPPYTGMNLARFPSAASPSFLAVEQLERHTFESGGRSFFLQRILKT